MQSPSVHLKGEESSSSTPFMLKILSILILFISIYFIYFNQPPLTRTTSMNRISRSIAKKVLAVQTPEGDGALVRRSIGSMSLRNLTPFLMLDHFDGGESKEQIANLRSFIPTF